MKADLHIHTIASDGSKTPERVVELAKKQNLKMIAVTDHDSIASVAAAKTAGKMAKLSVISGIEFSVAHASELHILGYFVDIRHPALNQYSKKTREAREKRVDEYVKRLRKEGIKLDLHAIQQAANGAMLSRVHLANAMVQNGQVKTIQQAFKRYLGREADTYIEKEKIDKKACIELIAACGGISVWAHPVYNMDEGFEDLLDEFLQYGLNGLEAYHPDHSDAAAETLDRLAQKKAMLVTSGSDFHGSVKPEIALGGETRSSEYLAFCQQIIYKKATEED